MTKYLSFALILLAACGDNKTSGDDGPPVDGALEGDSGVDAPPAATRAVIVSGDFTATGLASALDVETKVISKNVAPATAIGTDPLVRKFGSELFVINRIPNNNITILEASDFSLVEQIATGAGSNPHDVAVVGNHLYVPVYGGSGVVVLTRGSATVTPIALGATDDPDGKPNCASAYAVGTKVYVTCQFLDDTMMLRSRGLMGKVFVIETATNTVESTLTLTTPNPTSMLEQVPAGAGHAGDLVVGTSNYATGAGCIERITTGATPTAAGCLLQNAALGGYANRFDFSTTKMFVAVSDFVSPAVRTVDLATNALDVARYSKADQPIVDVAVCPDGKVVMAEQPLYSPVPPPAPAPKGLRIYAGANTEVTTTAIDIGLTPGSSHGLYCY